MKMRSKELGTLTAVLEEMASAPLERVAQEERHFAIVRRRDGGLPNRMGKGGGGDSPLANLANAAHVDQMSDRSRKLPSDPHKRAKSLADIATSENRQKAKNPAAVSLGRKGGLKGGKSRAAKMTPEERAEAARLAAQARWRKKD